MGEKTIQTEKCKTRKRIFDLYSFRFRMAMTMTIKQNLQNKNMRKVTAAIDKSII